MERRTRESLIGGFEWNADSPRKTVALQALKQPQKAFVGHLRLGMPKIPSDGASIMQVEPPTAGPSAAPILKRNQVRFVDALRARAELRIADQRHATNAVEGNS